MRKSALMLLPIFAGTAMLAVPAAAAPGDVMLSAKLDGASETPPASAHGNGMFMGRLNPAAGQLCYTLTSQDLTALTMAHIHTGAVGVAGPPVVMLMPSVTTETCIPVEKGLAAKIAANPGAYYVNIHNTPFPKGAIRGQLVAQ